MATQGQQRAALIAAVREMRRAYRKSDSQGEKVERELDRLIKRKTLITPRSLTTLGKEIIAFIELVNMLIAIFDKISQAVMANQPNIDTFPTRGLR